jgi:hypothetical protein
MVGVTGEPTVVLKVQEPEPTVPNSERCVTTKQLGKRPHMHQGRFSQYGILGRYIFAL